jgi:hypothetical protein
MLLGGYIEMKIFAKKYLMGLSIFFLGILIGAICMNLLEMRSRSIYRNIMKSTFTMEQEILAHQAAKNNNPLQELIHRWNVLNANSSSISIKIFSSEWDKLDKDFFFPVGAVILRQMDQSQSDLLKKGEKEEESILRGEYAYTLEKLGFQQEAKAEYVKALEITDKKQTIDQFKIHIKYLISVWDSIDEAAEKKILDNL